jgi:outer membrane lipopolysaccharide assembly protein LptE/RlpB
VTSDGRISEIELAHAVDMLVAESMGAEAPAYQPGQVLNRVEVTREYTYDETNVLGKENEARILREEMKRDLVRQIILRSIANLAPSVAS